VDRRSILKSIAALGAAAVIPGTLKSAPLDDRAEIERILVNGGTIENREFVFRDGKPIAIHSLKNVLIRNCTFTWLDALPHTLVFVSGVCEVTIRDCHFNNQTGGYVGLS
jgi:hypothetical protein